MDRQSRFFRILGAIAQVFQHSRLAVLGDRITYGVAFPSMLTLFTVVASLEYAARKRGGKGERYDDVHDAIIFDQDDDRQVLHDEWDQEIRDEKQAFIDEQKAKAEAEAKLKEKALKAEAREQADEEFGIIRDPETGEVLAVEPPEKD